jgi:hypothetical protein
MFCREAVADLLKLLPELKANGTQLTFVHIGTEEQANTFFSQFNLNDVPRVSDPEGNLYRAFGLKRAKIRQIINGPVMKRGFQAVMKGIRQGRTVGDPLRMPGVFLIHDGKLVKSYRHETVGDMPNYRELSNCETEACQTT